MQPLGKAIIAIGVILILVGIIVYRGWGQSVFGWFGHLPGDIRYDSGNAKFYFPIVSCILVSLVLTGLYRLYVMLGR